MFESCFEKMVSTSLRSSYIQEIFGFVLGTWIFECSKTTMHDGF